jgi:hypothetical protein
VLALFARLTGWDPQLRALEQALDEQVEQALHLLMFHVAEEAQARHPYQDRSGDLTGSIQVLDPTGRFWDGTLEGGVEASMEYASFVEEHVGPILDPIWEASEAKADELLDEALERAASLAGWS